MPGLNNRTIRAAIASGQRAEIRDGTMKGLHVVVTPTGAATFYVRYRCSAGQRRFRLGRFGVVTLNEARKLGRQALAEVARGRDPAGERAARRGAPTVREACERHMAEHARPMLKPSTVRTYASQVANDIVPRLGRRAIGDLDRTTVERFHRKIGERAPGAANRILALLSGVCSQAEAWGWRPQRSNPCHGIKRFREHRVRIGDAKR